MNELKLKPCPFCGGEAKLIGGRVYTIPEIDDSGAYVGADIEVEPSWVECQSCHAQGRDFCETDEDPENAVAVWNKRVTEEEEQKMNHEQTITWHERDTRGRFKELPEYGESILIATFEGVSYDEYHDFGSDGEYLIISGRNITDILAWAYMPEYKPGTLISESIERNKSKCYAHFTRVRESDGIVEITKCKNCLYYQDNNGGYPSKDCKWNKDETPDPDDYCSCGERMP